ncbi:MAG TPA: hypothetical protein VMU81_25855 [Acetobacteraceae bacterium]|jgi:hypothetical protein|nr:hypothetical protein [Acetobacteraceae bacterium]
MEEAAHYGVGPEGGRRGAAEYDFNFLGSEEAKVLRAQQTIVFGRGRKYPPRDLVVDLYQFMVINSW